MARILVIDDHTENRDLLTYLLGYYGHKVSLASGGAEGVSRALAELPDLILMDIAMPGMDGYTAARLMRAEQSLAGVPLIAISAGRVSLVTAQQAGFDDFFQMPIEPEVFIARIGPYLGGPEAGDARPREPVVASDAGLKPGVQADAGPPGRG
jgi:two-component system, cell cycle response regulator